MSAEVNFPVRFHAKKSPFNIDPSFFWIFLYTPRPLCEFHGYWTFEK